MMPIGFRVHGRGRFQENRPGFQGAHPRIDKSGNEFEPMIPPDPGELNTQVCESIKVNGQAKWNSIIGNRSKTSLPMIMNYKAVMEYLGYADGRQQATSAYL